MHELNPENFRQPIASTLLCRLPLSLASPFRPAFGILDVLVTGPLIHLPHHFGCSSHVFEDEA